jgi:hypothetical protein
MRLAQQVGGALAGDMRTFYGHLMGSPIEGFAREHFTRLSVWYSEDAVLVNLMGNVSATSRSVTTTTRRKWCGSQTRERC